MKNCFLITRILFLIWIFSHGIFTLCPQTIWYVDDDAPGDPSPEDTSVSDPLEDGSADHPFDAIQEGIDAAGHGDTVLVADGLYDGEGNRMCDFHGKRILVKSENGPENCVLGLWYVNRGFNFHSGETLESHLSGFRFYLGRVPHDHGGGEKGGAILIQLSSSPKISDCIIEYCSANKGGAICITDYSQAHIINCIIRHNTADVHGGGIFCSNESSPKIINCILDDNEAKGDAWEDPWGYYQWVDGHGGGISCQNCSPEIVNCIISNSTAITLGGGVYAYGSSLRMTNCLITDNYGNEQGGGIYYRYGSWPVLKNCSIIENRCSLEGGAIFASRVGGEFIIEDTIIWDNTSSHSGILHSYITTMTITYSDLQETYPGTGNINLDPRFVSGPLGDYYLLQRVGPGHVPASPCVNTGNPGSGMIYGTTRTDEAPDTGIIDIGYHYPTDHKYPPDPVLEKTTETGELEPQKSEAQ